MIFSSMRTFEDGTHVFSSVFLLGVFLAMAGIPRLVHAADVLATPHPYSVMNVQICTNWTCDPASCSSVNVSAQTCLWVPTANESEYFGCDNISTNECIQYDFHTPNESTCIAPPLPDGMTVMSQYYTCGECKTGQRHVCHRDPLTARVVGVTEYNCTTQDCSAGCTAVNNLTLGECVDGMTLSRVAPCETVWHRWYGDAECNDPSSPASGYDRIVLQKCIWAVRHAWVWTCLK